MFKRSRREKQKSSNSDIFNNNEPHKWPVVPEDAKKRVLKLLDKGEISISEETDKFANDFRKYIGTKFAIPEVNGTSALYSAFFAIGIKPGDEVICPTYTYWASAMPAAAQGAKIVFAESNDRNFGIDPADIKKKITDKTKAIVTVHLWGAPCDMDEINEIASEHNIKIIEDASHAHGATYKGKKIGNLGDIACFSFQGSKLLPAGEAGIFLTNNEEYYERAVALGHYERAKKLKGEYNRYGSTSLGFKFRMSPLHAAIGRVLLEKYDDYNAIISRNAEKVREALAELGGFVDYRAPNDIKRVYYENVIDYNEKPESGVIVDIGDASPAEVSTPKKIVPRSKLVNRLKLSKLNVSTSRYPLLHQQPYFVENGSDPNSLPRTQELVGRLIRLPSFFTSDESIVDDWIDKFTKLYKKLE